MQNAIRQIYLVSVPGLFHPVSFALQKKYESRYSSFTEEIEGQRNKQLVKSYTINKKRGALI